jgi:hypothetical protein
MSRDLFVFILERVVHHDSYFIQKPDALGVLGLSPYQKITAVFRVLCNGVSADSVDEYVRIGESTTLVCVRRFCEAIIEIFSQDALRLPNEGDLQKIFEENSRRGWPGLIGSLDCCHWTWKNCPYSLQGQFQNRKGTRSVILEIVAGPNLRIWYYHFGLPGSLNDINVLQRSPLLVNFLKGLAPNAAFTINGREHKGAYFLVDGIYPAWSIFVKSFSAPQSAKSKHFSRMQEGTRKDVEKAFGVLQARFSFIKQPCKIWDLATMRNIMKCCVILHNLIIENEGESEDFTGDNAYQKVEFHGLPFSIEEIPNAAASFHNKEQSKLLREDLVEHLWGLKGEESSN